MNISDWAVVLATFAGPISAVVITIWSQDRLIKAQERRSAFATMMRHRRDPTATDFVGALNLVPVYFANRSKVMQRYSALMATLADTGWKIPEAVPNLNERVSAEVAYLLSEISDVVGTKIDQLQILRGGYAPQGWADQQERQKRLQDALLDVFEHRKALPVIAVVRPSDATEEPRASA